MYGMMLSYSHNERHFQMLYCLIDLTMCLTWDVAPIVEVGDKACGASTPRKEEWNAGEMQARYERYRTQPQHQVNFRLTSALPRLRSL